MRSSTCIKPVDSSFHDVDSSGIFGRRPMAFKGRCDAEAEEASVVTPRTTSET
jgi:hypothetical protein